MADPLRYDGMLFIYALVMASFLYSSRSFSSVRVQFYPTQNEKLRDDERALRVEPGMGYACTMSRLLGFLDGGMDVSFAYNVAVEVALL